MDIFIIAKGLEYAIFLLSLQLFEITLIVQFVAESRFANCEFANLFFDFDESQSSRFQKFSQFITKIIET